MAETEEKYQVFLSAAEPSGDAHCAGLIKALKKRDARIEFIGVGGPKMAEAGCELLEVTVSRAAMIYNSFAHLWRFYKLIRRINKYFEENRVDLVVVCDSPAFNFHVAKAAKKTDTGTLFYVAPQLWAWGGWRIRKLRKYCDKLCCLLPFEEDWFTSRGVDTVFVGSPLLDALPDNLSSYKKRYNDFEPSKAVIAIMPGSRDAEIRTLWRPMQEIGLKLKKKYRQATFLVVAVDKKRKETLKKQQIEGFDCEYHIEKVNDTAVKADFSIVASGSATVQVAAAGCPMVIIYQSSRILWHLVGRWMVTVEYLSLVNTLVGKELVPEFMPYFTSVEPIVKSIDDCLQDKNKLVKLSSKLAELAQSLKKGSAADNTAKIVCRMLQKMRNQKHKSQLRV